MSLTIADLFANPDHCLFAFEGDEAVFVGMDRAAYHRSIFLDARIDRANGQVVRVPVTALLQYHMATQPAFAGPGWIFHIAHCGSTLLARALDQVAATLVLREPLFLRQLGVDVGGTATGGQRARIGLAAMLAGRRYAARPRTVVKANVPVNFIVPELMALQPAAPAIFLYFPLTEYLTAILRSANHRNWVRHVTGELGSAITAQAGDIAGLDDVERAAALWLAQMRIYAAAIDTGANAVSLNAELLFDTPRPVIAAAASLFGAPMNEPELDVVMKSNLFATHSKNPAIAFDNSTRRARQTEQRRLLRDDLTRARRWIDRQILDFPLPDRLTSPLIGASPTLLS